MRRLITHTTVALVATAAISAAATNDNAMLEKEKAAWQAFKDKKPDEFKKLLSANLMAVYAEGFSDMQKELADMQKWDMKSFAISDYKVMSAGSDTVVSTYKVKVEGTVSLDAGMDLEQKVGQNMALDAGQEIHLKSGMNLVIETGTSLTLKVGGNFINRSLIPVLCQRSGVPEHDARGAITGHRARSTIATQPWRRCC